MAAGQIVMATICIGIAPFCAVFEGLRPARRWRSRWKSALQELAESCDAIGEAYGDFFRILVNHP